MIVLRIAIVLILTFAVQAEKKIELQDIEEDNLRSEKQKDYDNSDDTPQNNGPSSGANLVPLEFLKSGLFRYFENPTVAPQQQRYVHQYAVTEPPERAQPAKVQYAPPTTQQAMVGYLSNIPMQIYLVPQYYSEQQQSTKPQIQYERPASVARVASYQTAPEQTQTNYIEVPTYTSPTAKPFTQQYTPSVTYVGLPGHPTNSPPQVTVTPAVTYQLPVIQYTSSIIQPTSAPKTYYQGQYSDTNSVDEGHGHYDDHRQQYSSHSTIQYQKPVSEFPRRYNSRAPYRDDYRGFHTNSISELPRPSPVLLKAPPPHLAHIPKVLPIHRPLTKPVYHGSSISAPSGFGSQSPEFYNPTPFKRRPTSLLDSYIPSSVQVEYLKRGLIKEPLAVYDALASGRLPHPIPRHYERGFLPNQMYHTAAGGVIFGHHKRTAKSDKSSLI